MSRFRHKNTYHHHLGRKEEPFRKEEKRLLVRREEGTLVQVCKFLSPSHPPLTQSRMVIIATRPSGSNPSGFGLVGSFEDLCALRGTQKKYRFQSHSKATKFSTNRCVLMSSLLSVLLHWLCAESRCFCYYT